MQPVYIPVIDGIIFGAFTTFEAALKCLQREIQSAMESRSEHMNVTQGVQIPEGHIQLRYLDITL